MIFDVFRDPGSSSQMFRSRQVVPPAFDRCGSAGALGFSFGSTSTSQEAAAP